MKGYYYILLFLLIYFVGDRTISSGFNWIVDQSNFRYSRMYNQDAECDYLFIGNSRGLVFYQPTIELLTQKRTLNLSYNGLPTKLAVALLKDYFDLYHPPKKVFIEATMRSSRPELVENFKTYLNKSKNIESIILEETPEIVFIDKLSKVYAYNSEIFHRVIYFYNNLDTAWLNNRTIGMDRISREENVVNLMVTDTTAINDLLRMKEICEENGSQAVFVINPYLPQYIDRSVDFEKYISDIENALGNVHNYAQLFRDHTYFADNVHLNKKGSRIYMSQLSQKGIL